MADEILVPTEAIQTPLLPLERQIIDLTVAGHSSGEVVRRLQITDAALQSHVASIFRKLCVANEFEMILCALDDHLVEPDESHTGLD